jgi:hypothetical protein
VLIIFVLISYQCPCDPRRDTSRVMERLHLYWSIFLFWENDQLKQKYKLLGVEVLDIKNKCLHWKWLFKPLNKEGV